MVNGNRALDLSSSNIRVKCVTEIQERYHSIVEYRHGKAQDIYQVDQAETDVEFTPHAFPCTEPHIHGSFWYNHTNKKYINPTQ